MAFSELWIISRRGELLVCKKYRNDISFSTNEEFSRILKKADRNMLMPFNVLKGAHLYHIERNDLYIGAASRIEMDNVLAIEILTRFYQLCKDFCGSVSESSVKLNYVLILEILDEIMNYGFLQISTTEKMKPYVQSTPCVLKETEEASSLFGVEKKVSPGSSSNKSVIKSRAEQVERKDEIFIDCIERISAVISASGSTESCELQGTVNMKTFLMGSPELKITFNEGVTVGQSGYGNQVYLEECKFHSSVNADRLSSHKIITVQPPEGEFVMMSYRVKGQLVHGVPLRLTFYIKSPKDSRDVEVGLKLLCDIEASSQAVNVCVQMPVPKSVTGIAQNLGGPGQSAVLNKKNQSMEWNIKTLPGKAEVTSLFKLIDGNIEHVEPSRLELGPIKIDFEISGFLCSNLHIKHIKVKDREKAPARWVRYITTPDSYLVKVQ